jgi:hypothetical protein
MPAQMCTPWLCIRRCRNDGRKKKRPEYDRNFSQLCSPSLKSGATERSVFPHMVHFVDGGF